MKYPKTLKGAKLCDFINEQSGRESGAHWGKERELGKITFMPCSAKLVQVIPVRLRQKADAHFSKTAASLKKLSLKKFLDLPPILIYESGVVHDGNHRVREAIRRGVDTMRAYVIHVPPSHLKKLAELQRKGLYPR